MAKAKKQSTTPRAARKDNPTRGKIEAFRARFEALANDAAAIVPSPMPAEEKRGAIIHGTISDLETAIIDIDSMASILLKLGEGRFQDSEIYSYLGGNREATTPRREKPMTACMRCLSSVRRSER